VQQFFLQSPFLLHQYKEGSIDQLVDKDCNFAQQALPYSESFLEPFYGC